MTVIKDKQYAHKILPYIPFVSEVFGCGKGQTRSDNTLNGRVIGQVKEKAGTLHGTRLLEIVLEETGSLHVHTHGTEHHSEVVIV